MSIIGLSIRFFSVKNMLATTLVLFAFGNPAQAAQFSKLSDCYEEFQRQFGARMTSFNVVSYKGQRIMFNAGNMLLIDQDPGEKSLTDASMRMRTYTVVSENGKILSTLKIDDASGAVTRLVGIDKDGIKIRATKSSDLGLLKNAIQDEIMRKKDAIRDSSRLRDSCPGIKIPESLTTQQESRKDEGSILDGVLSKPEIAQ